ncbi:hypothetical protein [Pontibacter cellulosilyticus]|uniref:Uncharacterized protein n=1 Tax=Pontibacter cellulosilyticus TaxID=1720253 RepID=A0A923N6M0_9BACT|nr:hypothetical protein [Pontibacter cellulosilyticus]MBC5992697.1 hypothetical protein [Pontibacter cellulosilyticus]
MTKDNIRFWLLFIVSIAISAVVISLFVKALKLVLYVILVLALAPVIYIMLRSIIPGRKRDDDKLKTRE